MKPDDPRHGTSAGYQAHRKDGEPVCGPCRTGRRRDRKRIDLDVLRGEQLMYTADELAPLLEPWTRLGLSLGAITSAAGLGSQYSGTLYATLRGDNSGARRSTYRALAAVTENDLPPNVFVYADLTRRRVYSLQAAGHRLLDLPIASTGRWRDGTHIKVFVARAIRDYFQANEFVIGPNRHTAHRALNAGHLPPLAWDDPGTLAWPTGAAPVLRSATKTSPGDDTLVDRILAGDWRLPCTPSDKTEVARHWVARGRSLRQLGLLTGWKPERYIRVGEAA